MRLDSPPTRLVIILLIAVAAVVGAVLILKRTPSGVRHKANLPTISLGNGLVGAPFKWRVLEYRRMPKISLQKLPEQIARSLGEHLSGTLGGLIAGQFDGGPDTELLHVGLTQSKAYKADGSSTPVGLHGDGFMMDLTAWDFDGDGVDEIVPGAIQYDVAVNYKPGQNTSSSLPTTIPVFKLDGRKMADLKWIPSMNGLVGDVDANGTVDLGFSSDGGRSIWYGQRGQPINAPLRRGQVAIAVANPFGLGEGLIAIQNRGREIVWVTAGSERMVGEIPFPGIMARPVDLDNDGKDELLFGGAGYLSSSKGFVPFAGSKSLLPVGNKTAVGDFLSTGQKQIAVLTGSSVLANELLIYNLSGQVAHDETFKETLWDEASILSGGKDYLCLQLSERILIYP